MVSPGVAQTVGILGVSLLAYSFVVAPPSLPAQMMLLFLTVPPAWMLAALGRRLGRQRPLPLAAQGALGAMGIGLMWGAPWMAQSRLVMHYESGAEGAPEGLVMALPILGPLLWALAVGWISSVREHHPSG